MNPLSPLLRLFRRPAKPEPPSTSARVIEVAKRIPLSESRTKPGAVGSILPAGLQAMEPDEALSQAFDEHQGIEPPLDFLRLCALFYSSSTLKPNIDAYVTNVVMVGWRPECTIDLFGPNASETVRKLLRKEQGKEPSEAAIQDRLEEWQDEARAEREAMEEFLEYGNPEESITGVRRKLELDYELLGNCALEITRDRTGRIASFGHVHFSSLRVRPASVEFVEAQMWRRVGSIRIEQRAVTRRFRSFVQRQDGLTRFFKEFGDPRVMSQVTGVFYQTAEEFAQQEPNTPEATEIWWHRQHAPGMVYGMPRWAGTLISVVGARASEDVNWRYFDNKSIPPIAIIFEGSRATADSNKSIEDFIETHIKGEENFHRILILEADVGEGDNASAGKIRIEKLTDVQNRDALFQNYDERSINKVGAQFRLPPMMRGQMDNVTSAGAAFAKPFAEEQVFGPERRSFDEVFNRQVLPTMRWRFWIYRTRTPTTRDPLVLSELLVKLVKEGILMPDEARMLLPDILGVDVELRDDEHFKQPQKIAIALIRARTAQERMLKSQTSAESPSTADDAEATGDEIDAIADQAEQVQERLAKRAIRASVLRSGADALDALQASEAAIEN